MSIQGIMGNSTPSLQQVLALKEQKEVAQAKADEKAAEADGKVREPDYDKYIPESKEKKAKTCTSNTDKVDREIEKLKKKKTDLEKQIHMETDEAKVQELERKLAQVENELKMKDNDAYRRQHAVFHE